MCTRDRVNNTGIIRTGCKVTLAAIYLRRDRVVGVAPAVGIPWLRGGRAPQVSAVATPPAPAAQNSARASGGPAGGRRVGACLGRWRALSRRARAPVIFSRCYAACACGTKARRGPPAALPGADVWGYAWAMAHIVACTTRVPPPNHFSNRRDRTIPARVAVDILACNKFSTDVSCSV